VITDVLASPIISFAGLEIDDGLTELRMFLQ
jgi:hypothetical protein